MLSQTTRKESDAEVLEATIGREEYKGFRLSIEDGDIFINALQTSPRRTI
jgi:hypothetical protein